MVSPLVIVFELGGLGILTCEELLLNLVEHVFFRLVDIAWEESSDPCSFERLVDVQVVQIR